MDVSVGGQSLAQSGIGRGGYIWVMCYRERERGVSPCTFCSVNAVLPAAAVAWVLEPSATYIEEKRERGSRLKERESRLKERERDKSRRQRKRNSMG